MSELMERGADALFDFKLDRSKEGRDKEFDTIASLLKDKGGSEWLMGNTLELEPNDFLYVECDKDTKVFTASYTNYKWQKKCPDALKPQLRSKKYMFYWDEKTKQPLLSISGEKWQADWKPFDPRQFLEQENISNQFPQVFRFNRILRKSKEAIIKTPEKK